MNEFNIKTVWYDPNSFEDLKNKVTKKTKLIYVENPGSNSFEFQDLRKIVSFAKRKNIYTATPKLGAADQLYYCAEPSTNTCKAVTSSTIPIPHFPTSLSCENNCYPVPIRSSKCIDATCLTKYYTNTCGTDFSHLLDSKCGIRQPCNFSCKKSTTSAPMSLESSGTLINPECGPKGGNCDGNSQCLAACLYLHYGNKPYSQEQINKCAWFMKWSHQNVESGYSIECDSPADKYNTYSCDGSGTCNIVLDGKGPYSDMNSCKKKCAPPAPSPCSGCLRGTKNCQVACAGSGHKNGHCPIPNATDPNHCCECWDD